MASLIPNMFLRRILCACALAFVLSGPTWADYAPATEDPIGIWISPAEVLALPTTGDAWDNLVEVANKQTSPPDVSDQEDPTNVIIMAKALVYVRTGDERYRTEVIDACMAAIGTEEGGRTLALARELGAYVVAADLVGLPPAEDATFSEWLRFTLTEVLDGKTLVSTHEVRPNNWGTMAGGTRMAVALYLKDQGEFDRAVQVFAGWLGDRSAYDDFDYGDLSWQADPDNPVGINPAGSEKSGYNIDGVLPEEMRRAGDFTWPPPKENYVYSGLAGALAQAIIAHRNGYPDVWQWSDSALLRAFIWLHDVADFPAVGDDEWQPHVINHYYGTDFPCQWLRATADYCHSRE